MNVGGSERRGGGGEEDSSADTTAAALETPRDDMRRAAAELQKRTEELEASVAEEEAALARARELRDALEARRDALLAQQRSGPGESALAAAQRRNTELRAENTQLKRTLLRFLNRYYPRPAPQPSRTRDDATPVPMKTLREIVQVCVWCLGGSDDDENDDGDDEKKTQVLMNRYTSAETPAQRYVRLDSEGIWGPYIELLLRSGVAEKHPNDSLLFRLSDL